MSLLVRLYPATWRARYGHELAAILEDRPPGPFDVADLLLGAIDANLHLRGLGNRSEHRKGIPMSLRLAGLAAVLGGASWAVIFVLAAAADLVGSTFSAESLIVVVMITGLILIIAAAGLSAFQFREHPRSIWLSVLVPAGGIAMLILAFLAQPLGDVAWVLMMIGVLATIIGSVIFAVVTAKTGVLSRTASIAIAAGAVIFVVGMLAQYSVVLLLISGIVFGAGWIGLGLDAIRRDRAPRAEQAAA